MPVITPPFDTRRIRKYVAAAGPTGSGSIAVDNVVAADTLASVVVWNSGVPADITGLVHLGSGTLVNDSATDYSGDAIEILVVHKSRPPAPVGPSSADGLQVDVLTGPLYPATPTITGMRTGDLILLVMALPAADTAAPFNVTSKFSAGTDKIIMSDNTYDLSDNKILVVWVPNTETDGSLLLHCNVTAGTAVDADVAVTGVSNSPASNQWGVIAFRSDGIGDRFADFVPGVDEFEKSGGTDDTGEDVVFLWSDGGDTVPVVKWRAVAGTADGDIPLLDIATGDRLVAVVRVDAADCANAVEVTSDYSIGTEELHRSSVLDQTSYTFLVWYEDIVF